MSEQTLTTRNHDRNRAGMTYVYPVVSRRAGGVSVGVNLNPNNACNWRCIYCQVPDLARGGPPPIDLRLLEAELRRMLTDIVQGDFMARNVPAEMRRLNDVALSGNGEPTSAVEFAEVVSLIGRVLAEFGLLGKIKLVLITNGSLVHKPHVQEGLRRMQALGGEVWFKLDRATREGIRQINNAELEPERVYANLKTAAGLCPTWLQTCLFTLDGEPPAEAELAAYLDLLARAKAEGVPLHGVLLYGLARPSTQPEAGRLGRLPKAWLGAFADRIRQRCGLTVKTSP
ncbi:wyosine [tRNA(Phe)-imidazoG37] synthetase (radical SAM superfamily) [Sulfuritortus calidifontis]|uniref:Wyosine [tRNA(Phe)-imidazoG37] synthetase (Radical SAM superfamily) n=1 Tax=Sulfuritortus calidifontis TaxID=1914471 RepID=A0A4R3JWL3_9PROT|nr:radical SAM protein [Sulfuritortus calidifontis]TCS72599.1 wyosine [tRNA(Phe)-imidazoG37] synthetase (radical SAM superfamily) [Sulfuritortus calidifontis]